jgi:GNAT superfamily N-acetyltransferase
MKIGGNYMKDYFKSIVYLYESTKIAKSPFYHISEENLIGKTLSPKVPENYMTKKGYEDNKIKRVSFSETIDGALLGISQDIKGKIFYVYEPENYNIKTLSNKEIVSKKYVPDAHLSKELWVLEDVKLKKVGKIKVIKAKPNPETYTYGDNIKAQIYYWEYEWIEKLEFVELKETDKNMPEIIKAAEKEWGSASEYFKKLSDKRIAFKLVDGDKLIGFFSIIFDDDTTGSGKIVPWLEKMYTFPNYRKQGFGTMMQQKAEEVAKEKGYKEMLLWTDLEDYYEKNGWKYETTWNNEKGEKLKLYSKKLK